MAPLSAAENWRQRQPITTTLRQICESYPPNTCLRELLQNADDAGASEIEYVLDTKTYSDRPLLHEDLKAYDGPALLVRNNSVFTDQDFHSLSSVGDSAKRFDPATTGRFGQGFNSVYHWTDSPWVWSREWLLLIDPHESWSEGGLRWNVVENHAAPEMQNVLKMFSTFDVQQNQPRHDTIIRIPLRTDSQAPKSMIVRRAITLSGVEETLAQFTNDLQKGGLLFLKNIRKVIVRLNDNVLSTAETPSDGDNARSRESVRLDFLQLYASQKPSDTSSTISKTFQTPIFYSHKSRVWTDEYLVHHRMEPSSGDRELDAWAREYKLFPWVSIAAPIKQETPHFEGLLFSTLSLHIRTQQPVHVHGMFAIAPDRARLSSDKLAVKWNNFMFERCVANGWTDLLVHHGLTSTMEAHLALWPRADLTVKEEDIWTKLSSCVIDVALCSQKLIWKAINGGRLSSQQALFCEETGDSSKYQAAWKAAGIPCIILGSPFFQAVTTRAKSRKKNLDFLTPRAFRIQLHNLQLSIGADAANILEYSLLDAIRDKFTKAQLLEVRNELAHAPIWPMLAGDSKALANNADTLMPFDDAEMSLFQKCRPSSTLDRAGLTPKVTDLLRNDANTYHVFARFRTLKDLVIDWPNMLQVDAKSTCITDIIPRKPTYDQLMRDIWTWITRLEIFNEPEVVVPLKHLFLIPLHKNRIRTFVPNPSSAPTLVLVDDDPLKKLLFHAIPKLPSSHTSIFDANMVTKQALHTVKTLALIDTSVRLATPETPNLLVEWLVDARGLIENMSDHHKKDLLDLLARIIRPVTNPEIVKSLTDQIRVLPIFSKCFSSKPYKAWNAVRSPITIEDTVAFEKPRDLPVLPPIEGVNLYEPSNENEMQVIRRLSLLRIDAVESLMDRFLLPWAIKEQTEETKFPKSALIDWLLRKVLVDRNPMWKRLATSRPLIPLAIRTNSQQYACVTDLIDPESHLAQLFFEDEGLFPVRDFYLKHKDTLRLCGIRQDFDYDTLPLDRARAYSLRKADETLVEKVGFLLATGRGVSLDPAKCQEIRDTKWFPATKNGQLDLYCPKEIRGVEDHDLVDKVWGTTTLRPNRKWKQWIGWDAEIPEKVVLTQLDFCTDKFDHARVDKLLEYISSHNYQPLLSRRCILGSRGKYLAPDRVFAPGTCLGSLSLEPHMDHVDPSFASRHINMLSSMGIPQEPSLKDVLHAQTSIYSSSSTPLDDGNLAISIALLELSTRIGCDATEVLVPDTKGILRKWTDIVHNEGFLTEKFTDFNFTHPKVSSALIKGLQIESCWDRAKRLDIEFDEGDADEFVPKEDIRTNIYDTLARYPVETTFNEFLANADDAGAESIEWTIDERQHPSSQKDSSLESRLILLDGPAVTVYNDSVFTDKDFEGLKRIGEGGKLDNAATTGMFGRGVMTMYHFTDVPMLLSGDSFIVLDPQQLYLPRSRSKGNKRKPGIKISISTARSVAGQQLSLFNGLHGFESHMDYYEGTIFRFALRDTTTKTTLTDASDVVTVAKARTLLDEYLKSARNSLLFLQSVTSIQANYRSKAASTWSVSASRVSGLEGEVFQNIITTTRRLEQKPKYDLWRIGLQDIDTSPGDIPKVGKGTSKLTECGIAACLQYNSSDQPGFEGKISKGHGVQHSLFCRLPVEPISGLPVSVHASFAITGDRKTVVIIGDNDSAKWNKWLLQDSIADLYIYLLKDMATRYGNDAFHFWPKKPSARGTTSGVLPATMVSGSFWEKVVTERHRSDPLYPIIFSDDTQEDASKTNLRRSIPRVRRKLHNITNAVQAHFAPDTSNLLQPLFRKLGLNIVSPPQPVWRDLKLSAQEFVLIEIGPTFLSNLLKDETKVQVLEAHLKSLAAEPARISFYASFLETLVPRISQNNLKDLTILHGCRILPRPSLDLPLGMLNFEKTGSWQLVVDETEQKLFGFASEWFVNTTLFKSSRMQTIDKVIAERDQITDLRAANANIRNVAIEDLSTLMKRADSPTNNVGATASYDAWLARVWSYFNERFAITDFLSQADLSDQPILKAISLGDPHYITHNEFVTGPYVVQPSSVDHQKLCSSLPGIGMVDPVCFPLLLATSESGLDKLSAFERLVRASAKAQLGTPQKHKSISTTLTAERLRIFRELLLKYLADCSDDYAVPNQVYLRSLPIWPQQSPPMSGSKPSHLGADSALFCEHYAMFMPWLKDLPKFVDYSIVLRYKECFRKIGVQTLSVHDVWARLQNDIPTSLSTTTEVMQHHLMLKKLSSYAIRTNRKIAPNGGGLMCQTQELYDHEEPMFVKAFEKESVKRFLHPKVRDLRSFFVANGLRHRMGGGKIEPQDFLECAKAVKEETVTPIDVLRHEERTRAVTSYLDYEKPEFASWPTSVWQQLNKICIFRTQEHVLPHPTYRHERMKSLGEENAFCALRDMAHSSHMRICWSEMKFPSHPPTSDVFQRMPHRGSPTLAKVYSHLQYLVSRHADVHDIDIPEYLQDIQACYSHLQKHQETGNLPNIRSAKIWFNIDSTALNKIKKSHLAPSLLPAQVLCLQAPCDTDNIIRTRKFLAPYDSLLSLLGCPAFVQPERPPPRVNKSDRKGSLGRTINELRKREELVDVFVEAQGTRVSAHKVVLAAASDFCKVHFAGEWGRQTADQCVVPFNYGDGRLSTLSTMIDFAYGIDYQGPILRDSQDPDEIASRLDEILDLLSCADAWQMLGLHEQVEDFITDTANATIYRRADNVKYILPIAEDAKAMRLVQDCKRYMEKNAQGMKRMNKA